jgi:hypothetical protein
MSDTPPPRFRLCDLSIAAKLGITFLALVLLGGLYASAMHIKLHYENRDEAPGVSMNDLKGAYHGVNIRAPLLVALESGHPETLNADDRKVLTDWLEGGHVSIDYDNLDLGDAAPAEIIARDCVSCHSEKAAAQHPEAAKIPLDTFEKVKGIAFNKQIDPPPYRILVLTTHTHALSLGTMGVAIAWLLLATRLPRFISHGLLMLMGIGLFADIGSWWLARDYVGFVYVIVAAGFVFNGSSALSLGLVILDTWFPRVDK